MAIHDLRAKRATAIDQFKAIALKPDFDKDKDQSDYDRLQAEIAAIDASISRAVEAQKLDASLARPAAGQETAGGGEEGALRAPRYELHEIMAAGVRLSPAHVTSSMRSRTEIYVRRARQELGYAYDPSRHFRNLGEQLQAIFTYAMTRGSSVDSRLVRAPTGAGEVDPTGGGFLVQVDFAAAIFMLMHDLGQILGLVNKIPISDKSNGLKIPGIDESSRATGSRWGGVQSYWAAEGVQPTTSKPKFRLIEFDLKKLISLMYVTDELLQDSTALSSIASQAFSEEVMFMTEDAIWEGTGAGQPLGILNSPARVTVAKQAGQATQTVVSENISNMWKQVWARSRKNAVWLINQDIEAQLIQMNQAVGTGGQLVYMPPGGLSGAPYATLLGRPVFATEYNSTLGTEGDIALVDLSQYTLVDKGGVRAATSMHVAFLTDEMVFRITYRVDGKPMWHTSLTPFKGTLPKSPFITLATR